MLENCFQNMEFQNMNYFSWIKLIPVLIHLNYRYYNTHPKSFPVSLTISSIQSLTCSSSVFLLCPSQFEHIPQVLDIPNHI